MIKIRVVDIPAVLEPRTAARATATFAGFLDSTTLGTDVTDFF